MAAVTAEKLWELWQKGQVKVEHCMGQAIQILMDQARTITRYGVALTRQDRQIERLDKEVRQLRKMVKALDKGLQKALDGK